MDSIFVSIRNKSCLPRNVGCGLPEGEGGDECTVHVQSSTVGPSRNLLNDNSACPGLTRVTSNCSVLCSDVKSKAECLVWARGLTILGIERAPILLYNTHIPVSTLYTNV